MLRTPLNPEVIIGNNRGNSESFSNFLTGSSKGPVTSDVASASNNIVGFSGSNVSNKTSDLTQLISSITTNVTNNINNSINATNQGFQKQIQSITVTSQEFEKQIQSITVTSQGFQKQIDSLTNSIQKSTKDSSKNSKQTDNFSSKGILEKFLKVYNNAIGFITTFADTKYIKRISSNLKALRNLFTESFNIAKILRQVIIKIVKQLSNLPTASPSAGGLNLDVNVPAGKLRQAGGPKIRNIGKALAIGGGVVAAGAAAIGMQNAQKFQQEKFASTTTETKGGSTLQEDFASKLGSIVDGFSKSVENLLKGNKKSPDISSTGGATGGGRRPARPPGGPPGGGSPGSAADMQLSGEYSDKPHIQALLKTIRFAEGTPGPEGYRTMFGGGKFDTSGGWRHPNRVIHTNGYSSAAAGAYQYMPDTWNRTASAIGATSFNPREQDRGAVFLTIDRLRGKGINIKTEADLEQYLQSVGGITTSNSNALSAEWASFPTTSGSSFYGQPVKKLNELKKYYQSVLGSSKPTATRTSPEVKVKPPNNPPNLSSVAPTPNTNQSPTIASISLPPEVYNTSNDSDNKSNPITPPMADGPTVAILPAGNGQNWWSLYSKMVYNIVDC